MAQRQTIGQQVAARRAKLKLSQRDLAAASGVLQKTICALECDRDVQLTSLEACVAALGCELRLVRRR